MQSGHSHVAQSSWVVLLLPNPSPRKFHWLQWNDTGEQFDPPWLSSQISVLLCDIYRGKPEIAEKLTDCGVKFKTALWMGKESCCAFSNSSAGQPQVLLGEGCSGTHSLHSNCILVPAPHQNGSFTCTGWGRDYGTFLGICFLKRKQPETAGTLCPCASWIRRNEVLQKSGSNSAPVHAEKYTNLDSEYLINSTLMYFLHYFAPTS